MPVHKGIDTNGPYYQWGHRKKYYYISGNKKSRDLAKQKAIRQGIAVHARGWIG